MHVNQVITNPEERAPHAADDIDRGWLEHHFMWERAADGHDRLVPRPQFAPWPWRGLLIGEGRTREYRLEPVRPEILDAFAAFLVNDFKATRTRWQTTTGPDRRYTEMDFQIGDNHITLMVARYNRGSTSLVLKHGQGARITTPEDRIIETISRGFERLSVFNSFRDQEAPE